MVRYWMTALYAHDESMIQHCHNALSRSYSDNHGLLSSNSFYMTCLRHDPGYHNRPDIKAVVICYSILPSPYLREWPLLLCNCPFHPLELRPEINFSLHVMPPHQAADESPPNVSESCRRERGHCPFIPLEHVPETGRESGWPKAAEKAATMVRVSADRPPLRFA